MKTIRAKRILILNFGYSGVVCAIFILLGINEFWEGDIDGGIFTILFSLPLILVITFWSIRMFCTHQIRYGNGKVVIKRVSKERVNGRPVGKWKNREDTFLLEEIDVYGLSWQVLGHYVEYHRSSEKSLTTEVFFQLKNGKRIGYETGYYTHRGEEEFFRYIYEGTGLELQK